MCGIVGVVAERNAVPILMEGLRRLEYRGYDSAGIAVLGADQRLARVPRRGQGEDARGGPRSGPHRGARRHRAYPLGHSRRSHPAQRPPARLARRHRGRAQRHHRESRGAARRTHRSGLHVRLGDRYRGDRAPDPPSSGHERRACTRRCAKRSPSSTGPTRWRWWRRAIPKPSSSRARDVRSWSDSASTRTSSLPTLRPCCRSRGASCFSRKAMSPRSGAHRSPSSTRTVRAPTRAVLESELPADAVERGPYRHFMLKEIHEQPRAIAQTLEERVSGAKLLDAAFGPGAQEAFKTSQSRAHRRLRHELSRGPRRRLFHRAVFAASRHASRSRASTATATRSSPPDTLFVTISQSGETADTLAALRNARRAGYLSTLVDLQRRRELHGARIRARTVDAGGTRDRRRLHQGLHHAAHGAWHAHRRAREAPRRRTPSASAS